MFFKICAIFALLAPLAGALTVATPSDVTTSDPVNITWTAVAGDPPVFTIQLRNPVLFNAQLAILNNADTGAMGATILLPVVPVTSGYTIAFVNISDVNIVYATSGEFSIGPATSTLSSTVTSSGLPPTAPTVNPTALPTSSSFGVTTTPSGTSTSPSSTGSSASSSSSPSASAFSNAAAALGISSNGLAGYALMAVAALAGAGFVGF